MVEPIRKKLESRIKDQQETVASLEIQLLKATSYLEALRDTLKLMPSQSQTQISPSTLREGSDLSKARDILRAEGRPLHVNEILKRMGKEVSRNSKAALAGSIGAYTRKNEIFTRPAPNSFGLTEFESKAETILEVDVPDDFGLAAPAEPPAQKT